MLAATADKRVFDFSEVGKVIQLEMCFELGFGLCALDFGPLDLELWNVQFVRLLS